MDQRSRKLNPMFKLLKRDVKYEWTKECDESFRKVKQDILKRPFTQLLQFNKQFILTTGGSFQAIVAHLSKRYDEG